MGLSNLMVVQRIAHVHGEHNYVHITVDTGAGSAACLSSQYCRRQGRRICELEVGLGYRASSRTAGLPSDNDHK